MSVVNLALESLYIGNGLNLSVGTLSVQPGGNSSLTVSGGGISLIGDSPSPGALQYYGTDAGGNYGWFAYGGGGGGATGAVTVAMLSGYSGFVSGTYATITNLALSGSNLYIDITGMSGQANLNYATSINLGSTGSSLYQYLLGLSGIGNTTITNLASTGSTLYSDLVGLSGQVNNSLASTGSILYKDLTGLSGVLPIIQVTGSSAINPANFSGIGGTLVFISGGYVIVSGGAGGGGSYDPLGTAANTGQILYNDIVGMSGQLNTTIASTGQQSWTAAQNNATNISGNLTSTGSILYQDIVGLSGISNTTITNLGITGSTLYNDLTGLSGAYATTIASTGQQAWNAANNNALNLSGRLVATGALLSAVQVTGSSVINAVNFTGLGGTLVFTSGAFTFVSGAGGGGGSYDPLGTAANTGQILYNDMTGMSGQFNTNLTQTGINLIALIGAAAAGVSSLNGLSGVLTLGSSGYLTFQTGVGALTIGVTGLATAVNLTSTGSTLYVDLTGLSGQFNTNFATVANLALTGSALYVDLTGMSGQANLNYATILNLASTGSTLYGDITSMSGALGTTIASTGSTLYVDLTGLSGQANINYATIVNLGTTGSNLYIDLTGLSGQFNTNFATVVNLGATGSTLYVDITGLSGAHNTLIASTGQQAWNAANNNGINLSGNLTATGATLFQRDTAISGALQAQIAGANGTQVQITGSATQTNANFTGIGGTLVFLSGGYAVISGGAGGGGAGTTIISANNQVIFNNNGTISGDPNLLWSTLSGSLAIGQPNLLPTNPLALAGSGANTYIQASIQNTYSGTGASSDWVATTDNGNDNNGYVDIGINSSTYNQPAYSVGSGNDAYAYVNSGNFAIGTQSSGNVIRFHTDGTRWANIRATISTSGLDILPSGDVRVSGVSLLGFITGLSGITAPIVTPNYVLAGPSVGVTQLVPSYRALVKSDLPAGTTPHTVTFSANGNGSPLITGLQFPFVKIPFGGTLQQWTLGCYPSGSLTVDIYQAANGSGVPYLSMSNGGVAPSIAAGVESGSASFTNWASTSFTGSSNVTLKITTVDGIVQSTTLVLYYQ